MSDPYGIEAGSQPGASRRAPGAGAAPLRACAALARAGNPRQQILHTVVVDDAVRHWAHDVEVELAGHRAAEDAVIRSVLSAGVEHRDNGNPAFGVHGCFV